MSQRLISLTRPIVLLNSLHPGPEKPRRPRICLWIWSPQPSSSSTPWTRLRCIRGRLRRLPLQAGLQFHQAKTHHWRQQQLLHHHRTRKSLGPNPSFSVPVEDGHQISAVFTRTVTNVGSPNSTYTVSMHLPTSIAATVEPSVLSFSAIGEKKSFKVHVYGPNIAQQPITSGEIMRDDGVHFVRSPLVVFSPVLHTLPSPPVRENHFQEIPPCITRIGSLVTSKDPIRRCFPHIVICLQLGCHVNFLLPSRD